VIRRLLGHREPPSFVVLDFRRVPGVDAAAMRLLVDLVRAMGVDGTRTILTGTAGVASFVRFAEEQLDTTNAAGIRTFAQLEAGIEWCENALIEQASRGHGADRPCELPDQQLCKGMSEAEIARLSTYCERTSFPRGATVIRKGEAADRLFFVVSGECSATLDIAGGQQKRLSTIAPGMAFGEAGVLTGGVRTADVRADTALECLLLTRDAFERMGREEPPLQNALLRGLLRVSSSITDRLTREVAALEA
jgi:CRP-like cAMP-binding protein